MQSWALLDRADANNEKILDVLLSAECQRNNLAMVIYALLTYVYYM